MLNRSRRFSRWNRLDRAFRVVFAPSLLTAAGKFRLTALVLGWAMACAIAATTAWTPIAGFSTRQNVSAQEPPKLNLAGELQALGGLDSGLAGDLGLGEGETVTLTATLKAVNGGPAGVLEVEAKIAADWHLYSLTQPPGGPLRTKLELLATPPLELTGAWKAAQPPKIRRVPEYPGVDLEEHSDKILWTAPVKLPAGVDPDKYGLRLKLSGLTCRDNDSCLPVKLTTAVKLVGFLPSTREAETAPAANPAASANPAPGKVSAPGGASAAGGAPAAPAPPFAGKPGPFRAMLSHGEINGHVMSTVVRPGDIVSLVLTAKPQPGWHFYTLADIDPEDGSPFKPTVLAIDLPPGWTRSAVVANKPTVSKPVPGSPPAVFFEGEVSWSVELRVAADAPSGPQEIRGILAYQTCNDSTCDRPTGVAFRGVVEVAGNSAAGGVMAPLEFQASSYGKGSALAKSLAGGGRPEPAVANAATGSQSGSKAATIDLEKAKTAFQDRGQKNLPQFATDSMPSATPSRGANDGAASSWSDIELVTGDDKDATLGSVLVLAVVGGFLLNFMPCVLPVIGLKVMSFVNQAHGNRRQVFMLNWYYFLGLMAVFLVLATLAAVFQFGWGKQFQSTGFNLALAATVFVFALSMLGVWEIPLPGFVGSGAAAEASEQEGPLGAFLKGALTTVLATPCTGPFMGTALTWAAKQPPPVIYATFTALGLGMGLPYLAIGMFPRLLKFLPKPGIWMETFKQVMGFVLLGTVVFIFTFLEKDFLVAASGLLVGLGVACWWIGRSPVFADLKRKAFDWSVAVAIGGVIGWVSFATFGPSNALLPWRPFSRPELERQLASGQTVLVDFTAEWCLTCKVNEATALNTKRTLALVQSQQLVVVKADKTHEGETSEAIDQLLTDLGHTSHAIPFLVIFPGDGKRPIAFSGPVTQRMVLDAIRRAGPSRPQGLAVDPPSRRDS